MRLIYFSFISLLCGTYANVRTVPVFLVDNENILPRSTTSNSPFKKITSIEFIELLHTVKKMSSCVIIFVETELCAEDISVKDKIGSPYYHLRQSFADRKVLFYPSVVTPYLLLTEIFRPHHYNIFYLRSKTTKLHMYDHSYKYFYVFFEDGSNETRADALRRHDSIMKEVYLVIKALTAGPVLAFYTGKSNPINVPRIKPEPLLVVKNQNKAFFTTDFSLIALYGVSLYKSGVHWPLTDKVIKDTETAVKKNVTLNFVINNFGLSFNFKAENSYWELDSIFWNEEKEIVGDLALHLRAPWNTSYACSVPFVIVNKRDTSVLTIARYQMELVKEWLPPADQAKLTPLKRRSFRSTNNCQPYYNVVIVSCLFLVSLLIIILFFGIIMMMDVNTNSRYDDPQGKPLVIGDMN